MRGPGRQVFFITRVNLGRYEKHVNLGENILTLANVAGPSRYDKYQFILNPNPRLQLSF